MATVRAYGQGTYGEGDFTDPLQQGRETTVVNKSLVPLPPPVFSGMKLKEDVIIGDLVLNNIDSNNVIWVCTEIDGWWEHPDPVIPDIPRGWGDGSYDASGRWAARQITLSGVILPPSPEYLSAARETLVEQLDLVRRGVWLKTLESPTRSAFVRLSGKPQIQTVNARGRTEFSVGLRAADPIKYSWNDSDPDGYNVATIPCTASSASITGSTTIQNVGNTPVTTFIEINGPLDAPATIYNSTNDELLTIVDSLRSSDSEIVTNKILTSNVATLTTASTHTIISGDVITVSGVDEVFDGTFVVSTVASNTVSYSVESTDVASTACSGSIVRNADKLEINTYSKEVAYNGDTLGARVFVDTLTDWITLNPGANVIQFTADAGSGTYVTMPGETGSFVQINRQTAIGYVSDLEFAVRVTLDRINTLTYLTAWGGSNALFYIGSDNKLNISLANTAAALIGNAPSSVAVPGLSAGSTIWLRAKLTVSSALCEYWYSTSDTNVAENVTWTSVGVSQTGTGANTTAIVSGASIIYLGTNSPGTASFSGRFYSGIETVNGCITNRFSAEQLSGSSLASENGIGVVNGSLNLPGAVGAYASVPDSSALDILGTEGTKFLSLAGQAAWASAPSASNLEPTGAESTKFLYLPGRTSNYASIPDSSELDIIDDIEIVARIACDDWTPAATSTIAAKWTDSGNQRGWALAVNTAGTLAFSYSTNGTAFATTTSTVATGFTDGTTRWIKVTFKRDHGAGNAVTSFFTAADSDTEPSLWTQLGTSVSAGGSIASIFANTASLTFGVYNAGATSPFTGEFYRFILRKGIGGVTICDVDFSAQTVGATSFTTSTGHTVTVTGSATRIVDHSTFLLLPGDANSFAYAPDTGVSGVLDVSGDLTITVRVAMNSWTPASDQIIVGKGGVGNQYYLALTNTGLKLGVTLAGGSETPSVAWTTGKPATAGTIMWIRAVRVQSTGVVTFSYAADSVMEPATFTTITTASSTIGAIVDSANPLGIGAGVQTGPVSSLPMSGKIYRVIVKNNTTTVFDADFSRQIVGSSTFTESSTNAATTTINTASAKIDRIKTFELICRAAVDSYVSAAEQTLISKYGSAPNRGYRFYVTVAGNLAFSWSTDGTNDNARTSTSVIPFSNGVAGWFRVLFKSDNGANGHDVEFYTAADSTTVPSSWTILGTTVTTSGTTTTITSTQTLDIGSRTGGAANLRGKVFRAIVRNSIGGSNILDADFTTQSPGTSSFTSTTGQLITLTGATAKITDATTFFTMPSTSSSYASAPHNALMSITGDIEVVCRVMLHDYTTTSLTQTLVAKRTDAVAQEYSLAINATGQVVFTTRNVANTTNNAATITPSSAFVDNTTYWIRVTRAAASGTVSLYVAADQETEPTTWGTAVTGATPAEGIFSGTAVIEVGSRNLGANDLALGRMYRVIIRNGIGTAAPVIFDADFSRQVQFSTTFTDATSIASTVTINGAAGRIERDRSFELVVRAAMNDWTPISASALIGKWATSTPQRSYAIQLSGTTTTLLLSNNGTNSSSGVSTTSLTTSFVDKQAYWIKITYNALTRIATFYSATDASNIEPVTWTTAATVSPAATTPNTFLPGTGLFEIGSVVSGTAWNAAGKFYRTIVRNGIGGSKVLDISFEGQFDKTTSLIDSAGLAAVTVFGSQSTSAVHYGNATIANNVPKVDIYYKSGWIG